MDIQPIWNISYWL